MNTGISTEIKARGKGRERGTGNHPLNGLNSADGLLRKGEPERHRAQQFPADINRAAAHSLQNAGLSQRSAAQTGQYDGLLGAEILQDSEDLDLELFDLIALEDCLADSVESRMDILQGEELLAPGSRHKD